MQPAILVVTSAIHGEIRMPLPAQLSIGRAISSDLVLADPSVGTQHLRLTAGATFGIEAIDHPILFDDGSRLEAGETRALGGSCSFRAGAVPMVVELPDRVSTPAGAVPQLAKRRSAKSWLLSGAVAVAFAGSAAFAMSSHALQPPQPVASGPAGTPTPHNEKADVRRAILAELDARHLPAIEVSTLPDGSHRAHGSIGADQSDAWRDAKHWVDATFGSAVVLVDAVVVVAVIPVLSIQSAWLGDVPYVIEGNGEKLFAGAVLGNGWVIEAIEAGRVLLRRQNQRMAVKF